MLQKNTNMNKFLEAASTEASHDCIAPESKKDIVATTKLLGPGETDTIYSSPHMYLRNTLSSAHSLDMPRRE